MLILILKKDMDGMLQGMRDSKTIFVFFFLIKLKKKQRIILQDHGIDGNHFVL